MKTAIIQIIDDLHDTGQSASIAVAEHLDTVAKNGGDQDTPESMFQECAQLIDAATAARDQIRPHAKNLERQPALTHGEAIDFFPILRGMRDGFGDGIRRQDTGTGTVFSPSDRMIDGGKFYSAAIQKGSGAEQCAAFCYDLIHGGRFSGSRYNLSRFFAAIDSEHRAAAVALFAAVAERGIK